jgi:hypothetical protein
MGDLSACLMPCSMEQFESDLKVPLIVLGYNVEGCIKKSKKHEYITNNYLNIEKLVEFTTCENVDYFNRYFIRRYNPTYYAPKRYGRNEMVMVKLPSGETEFMKYKKAQLIPGVEVI